ncbi:MAG TPA: class I SAM-dependent methyltransferase [Trueperaceae bacterium]|nr:class I SAM-dependent methyltransferase [Trueperaceae bacterium]
MSDQGVQVVVVAANDADTRVAHELATRLSTPLAARAGEYPDAVELVVGHRGLALRRVGGPVVTARTDLLQTPRAGGADLLHRAVLAGATDVIDATAGLGADAFHLAARGLEVTMIERSGVFASLLADALERARAGEYGPSAAAAAGRLRLHVADAREVLPTLQAGVVLLDPMFPASASTAAPKKGMNLFRELLPGAAAFEEEHAQLLMAARRSATRRVVVKRALRSPHLAGVAPSGSLSGRTVRFDLYAPLEHRGSRT